MMDPSYCHGDFNADGFIDGTDFVEWNDNRFMSSGLIAVPEPALGVWLLTTLAWLLVRHRD
jgi:hypothetical protein